MASSSSTKPKLPGFLANKGVDQNDLKAVARSYYKTIDLTRRWSGLLARRTYQDGFCVKVLHCTASRWTFGFVSVSFGAGAARAHTRIAQDPEVRRGHPPLFKRLPPAGRGPEDRPHHGHLCGVVLRAECEVFRRRRRICISVFGHHAPD